MWVYDPVTLRFLAVNEAAVAHYGYSRDEFFQLRVFDLSVPEERDHLVRMIAQVRPGRSAPVEWRQMRKDGTEMAMEIFGHDIVFESRPARMALARDVTQRNQLEEQRLYTQELEFELSKERELAEMRERFMSMVSHEFRTPLSIISTSVDIIERYYDRVSREKILERMADIHQQIASMSGLLEDVLTILRGNAGKVLFSPEKLDIVELCARAIENIRLTDRSQHELVFEPETPALVIEADHRLLQHIVTNLITNAVKYSPPGTRVRVIVRALEGAVLFSVEDEGIGIPPEDQPYVFQPFHRARNAATIEGTGLGLSIVKQNVELHGGHISFHSVENQGTVFAVRLPRTMPAPAEMSTS
jgi:PAS domain S-box-containing protein